MLPLYKLYTTAYTYCQDEILLKMQLSCYRTLLQALQWAPISHDYYITDWNMTLSLILTLQIHLHIIM